MSGLPNRTSGSRTSTVSLKSRAGMFSSCLRSNLNFCLEKQQQDWTLRLALELCIPTLTSKIRICWICFSTHPNLILPFLKSGKVLLIVRKLISSRLPLKHLFFKHTTPILMRIKIQWMSEIRKTPKSEPKPVWFSDNILPHSLGIGEKWSRRNLNMLGFQMFTVKKSIQCLKS